jgi:hypothetical protein
MSMLSELSTPLKLASMPMSMLSKLFTAGSTATAAKAATTAANELGAAHAVGLASSTRFSGRHGDTGRCAIVHAADDARRQHGRT